MKVANLFTFFFGSGVAGNQGQSIFGVTVGLGSGTVTVPAVATEPGAAAGAGTTGGRHRFFSRVFGYRLTDLSGVGGSTFDAVRTVGSGSVTDPIPVVEIRPTVTIPIKVRPKRYRPVPIGGYGTSSIRPLRSVGYGVYDRSKWNQIEAEDDLLLLLEAVA